MKVLRRRMSLGVLVLCVGFATLGMPASSVAHEPAVFKAPYQVGMVCYKIPLMMYYSRCTSDDSNPGSTGVLVAGGGKSAPNISGVPNGYLPYVESMSGGVDFTATEGGVLHVVAKLSGVQAGVTTSSEVCLIFSVARDCSVNPLTSTLTASADVAYLETVRVLVQARTSYAGGAAAVVESITVTLIPDEVVY